MIAVKVKATGVVKLQRMIRTISPKSNPAWVRRALIAMANRVQAIATKEMIIPGGRVRVAGPKGGKGIMTDKPAHPTKLTSRTGALRSSIRVNRGPLPHAIEVGSDLEYAAVHEEGLGRYPKRPFLQPALEKASPEFSDILSRELKREIDNERR
jgi:phage gpG-like protein